MRTKWIFLIMVLLGALSLNARADLVNVINRSDSSVKVVAHKSLIDPSGVRPSAVITGPHQTGTLHTDTPMIRFAVFAQTDVGAWRKIAEKSWVPDADALRAPRSCKITIKSNLSVELQQTGVAPSPGPLR